MKCIRQQSNKKTRFQFMKSGFNCVLLNYYLKEKLDLETNSFLSNTLTK